MNKYELLHVWREERGLQGKAGNYTANILEEVVEYLRAADEYERVDALCDIQVFTINALAAFGIQQPDLSDTKSIFIGGTPFISSIGAAAIKLLEDSSRVEHPRILLEILKATDMFLNILGFIPEACMMETIKEISSRTGAYNPITDKWEKFKTPEAMAKWYSADYSKCRAPRAMALG